MAVTPYRCTVTIDGTKFNAVSSSVRFSTQKDRAGIPLMGSLNTSVRVYANFHDDQNLPNSVLKKLFNLANVVTRDKVKPIKLEFWKDDNHADALASYSFNGWISRFETSNPHDSFEITRNGDANHPEAPSSINHILVLDLEPVMNQQNFSDIQMSN
jgi:hypothetical protein